MSQYQVAGSDFACHLCQGREFTERTVKLNTTVMSFFDFDFLNKSATGLICEGCGYVHLFFRKSNALTEIK